MTKCPRCNHVAYVGLLEVKCSNKECEHFDPAEAKPEPPQYDYYSSLIKLTLKTTYASKESPHE